MEKITQYSIVTAKTSLSLITLVNEKIKEGWQPKGGVQTQQVGKESIILQALVR